MFCFDTKHYFTMDGEIRDNSAWMRICPGCVSYRYSFRRTLEFLKSVIREEKNSTPAEEEFPPKR